MIFQFLEKLEEKNIQNLASGPAEAEEILKELKELGLFLAESNYIKINPDVQVQIKSMLCCSPLCMLKTKTKPDNRRPTIDVIASVTQQNWKKMIDYLIGLQENISVSMFGLLKAARLISQPSQNSQRTSDCFRFLLKTQSQQIEFLLRSILALSRNKVKTATIFYNLSIAELGKDYSRKDADPALIDILAEIGLIYRYNSKSKRYYVPSTMIGLLTDSPKPVPETEKFLVVETNFRIYAYTDLDLHIVLLSYFLKMEYRLPGLVVGNLNRDSICNALKSGLQASQIIEFLKNHSNNLPINVEDQLNLWEKERNRISEHDGILIEDFADLKVFKDTLSKAQECGAYLWHHQNGTLIILKKNKAEPVIKHLQKLGRVD